ncbi:MAG: SCO family protein [Bacteroidetes bacterium]|nr:SCO family protein [Bacteroidota bacterium]
MKAPVSNPLKKYATLLSVMLALPLLGLLILGIDGNHHFSTLPYYSEAGAIEMRSDEAAQVQHFALTNHLGEVFDSNELGGKVWLAAFFSTNSPHVAQFTKQLLWPNFRYRDEDDITMVCFTLDASHDTPEVLKSYVDRNTRYNGFEGKWQFLTGDQKTIDSLIASSFMIQRDQDDPNNIATLWLVDEKGYLRGVYHAASEDAIKDAVEDIALLQKEMDERAYKKKKLKEAYEGSPPLPILGPEEHVIPAFSLIDSDSIEFSHRDCQNTIRIVDFFFTRCPTICPIMSSQMARMQSELSELELQGDVLLLSHSVDPAHDRPSILQGYGNRLGQDAALWKLLTGEKEDIYDLAKNGYFMTAIESDTAQGGIFHSDLFALVDRRGRIRGYYDGTDTEEVNQLLIDVKQLWATNE